MQLGSSGLARPVIGRATNKLLARSIHIPLPRPAVPAPSATQRVVRTTRSLFSRFVAHLTTPGTLRAPIQVASTRGIQHLATRTPGISNGLSLPVRHALGRPLGAPHLPRAPVIPRSVTQVGLGCARTFHSARPVFQSLADNAPVVVRALAEAELDLRGSKPTRKLVPKMLKAAEKAQRKQKMMENAAPYASFSKEAPKAATSQEEMEHYFPTLAICAVTTQVLIPLAPIWDNRRPLQERPTGYLLMASLASIHASYGTHALRVSSLFTRLDRADVFDDPSVRCVANTLGTTDGSPQYLRVTFEGWTEERVRALLGDAGKGWCEIEEIRPDNDVDSVLDDAHSDGGDPIPWDGSLSFAAEIDPAQLFILPTIDLSGSVDQSDASTSNLSWSMSPLSEPSDMDDVISHISLSDDEDAGEQPIFGPGPSNPSSTTRTSTSWLGVSFSSRFADVVAAGSPAANEPAEYLF